MTTINASQLTRADVVTRTGKRVPQRRYHFLDRKGVYREIEFVAASQAEALEMLSELAYNLTLDHDAAIARLKAWMADEGIAI